MSQQDKLVLADAESSIAEHAGFAGLAFLNSDWKTRQIVCPTFPNHLFVQYTRNNGAGDVTVFSAVDSAQWQRPGPHRSNSQARILSFFSRADQCADDLGF